MLGYLVPKVGHRATLLYLLPATLLGTLGGGSTANAQRPRYLSSAMHQAEPQTTVVGRPAARVPQRGRVGTVHVRECNCKTRKHPNIQAWIINRTHAQLLTRTPAVRAKQLLERDRRCRLDNILRRALWCARRGGLTRIKVNDGDWSAIPTANRPGGIAGSRVEYTVLHHSSSTTAVE